MPWVAMASERTGCEETAASLKSEYGMNVCLQPGEIPAIQEEGISETCREKKIPLFRGGEWPADGLMREFSRLRGRKLDQEKLRIWYGTAVCRGSPPAREMKQ